jgi:hypothetical protein
VGSPCVGAVSRRSDSSSRRDTNMDG